MQYDPILVPNFQTGLVTDEDPWNLPLDAFTEMDNAHIHNKVMQKRQGYSLFGKIVHGPAVSTDWDIISITQANPGVVEVNDTTGLSNGNIIVIHDVSGMTEVNGNEYVIAGLSAGAPGTFQLTDEDGNNVNTTSFTPYINNGVVYTIPQERVMGLERYINVSGDRILLGFDTKRAVVYNSINQRFQPLDVADIFDSSDTDYVIGSNWASAASSTASLLYRLYFTNGKAVSGALNGIRYYDAATAVTNQFRPQINSGGSTINGCKFIFAIRERLVLLHTFEAGNTYQQRARWSQAQNPGSGSGSGQWDDNTPGRGGFVDAPTGDQIISAIQLQDIIMVFMTDSVWYLTPVSDPALPFRWVKINSYRSIGGKMASVGYDRYGLSAGPRGLIASDTTESKRIDQKIHDFVFDEVNSEYFDKVVMGRSFGNRRFWMLYPGGDSTEADSALIMDEETGAFSKYTIPMNVLGYGNLSNSYTSLDFIETNFPDPTGNGADPTSQYFDDETSLSFTWHLDDDQLIGGDRSGVVYLLENSASDYGSDINMTIKSPSINPSEEAGTTSRLGYVDFMVSTDQLTEFTVKFFKDTSENPYSEYTLNCIPNLNYISNVISCVAKTPATDGVRIISPNHGLSTGNEIYIYGVKGMEEVNDIKFSITFVSINSFDISVDATSFGTYTQGGGLYENKFYKTAVWKRAYAGGIGYQHQYSIEVKGAQKPFELHRMKYYMKKDGSRTIG